MIVAALLALSASAALAEVRPGELLIYYAYPSSINGVSTLGAAAAVFGLYDIAILGDGLQDGPGDPLPHPDHDNTVQIMAHPAAANTHFFGYIDLGVSTTNLNLTEIRRRVDAWQEMGIDGIFLDDFGYDYNVTRTRQNSAVDYVHGKGLPVCANGWTPSDVFGSQVHAKNPGGLPTHLGAADYYLSESHQVAEGVVVSEAAWQGKANALVIYQRQLGFKILSNTTPDTANTYNQSLFNYAWFSAALYGHVATGWGEYLYAAPTALAPYRPRPLDLLGAVFKSGVGKTGSVYSRSTERGTLSVNATTHVGSFAPAPDDDGDGVGDAYDVCPDTAVGASVKPDGSPLGDLDCNCAVDLHDFSILQLNAGQ